MIPRKTPCVVVYNTRMPREWYDYFMARAKKHNMTVAAYITDSIRRRATVAAEQHMAATEGVTVTAIRQRLLREAHPNLPEWDSGESPRRRNTPTSAIEDKSTQDIMRDQARTFTMTVPMTQARYYGTREMAARRKIDDAEMAREIYKAGYDVYKALKPVPVNKPEADNAEN